MTSLFTHLASILWSRDHYHYSRRKASQCDCLNLVLFCRRTKKLKAWKQSHKMRMRTIETGNPSPMPIVCGSKTDSQERDPRTFLVEEGNGNVACSPLFLCLVWPGQTLGPSPLSSCQVCTDPLVYWRAQRRGGRAKLLTG